MEKNLPAMQETQVQSLAWEDPLEEEMETHSSILAWETSWTEEPGGLQCLGSRESDMTEHTCALFTNSVTITQTYKTKRRAKPGEYTLTHKNC